MTDSPNSEENSYMEKEEVESDLEKKSLNYNNENNENPNNNNPEEPNNIENNTNSLNNSEGVEENEQKTKKNNEKTEKTEGANDSETDSIKQKEAEYIAQIEQLANELEIEQGITKSLNKDPIFEEEVSKLQEDLNNKNSVITQLKNTNTKQQEALENLQREADTQLKKHKQKSQSSGRIQIKLRETSKNEPVNIILKVKDKELSNALALMNSLKKDNQDMKEQLYRDEDYNDKVELFNIKKDKTNKINQLNTEIKLILKQLDQHKNCVKEQENLNGEINKLKQEISQSKNDNLKIKDKIRDIGRKLLKLELGEEYSEFEMTNRFENTNNKNNSTKSKIAGSYLSLGLNKKNITPSNFLNLKNKKSNENNEINYKTGTIKDNKIFNDFNSPNKSTKTKLKSALPAITLQTSQQSILTEIFKNNLKAFLNNENEFDMLVTKIKNIESSSKTMTLKHKNELKQFDNQILDLEKQYKLLNEDGKGVDSNIRIMKHKICAYKNEFRQLKKKIEEHKKNIVILNKIRGEKDDEIQNLIEQLNNLRKIVSENTVVTTNEDEEVGNYIEKVKLSKTNTETDIKKETKRTTEKISEKDVKNTKLLGDEGGLFATQNPDGYLGNNEFGTQADFPSEDDDSYEGDEVDDN